MVFPRSLASKFSLHPIKSDQVPRFLSIAKKQFFFLLFKSILCAVGSSDGGTVGASWEQDTPTGTAWHRHNSAPAPERVSHCTPDLGTYGTPSQHKKAGLEAITHPPPPFVFFPTQHTIPSGVTPHRQTPPVANGRPLNRLGRTHGCGSSSHLMRAFPDSKLLHRLHSLLPLPILPHRPLSQETGA